MKNIIFILCCIATLLSCSKDDTGNLILSANEVLFNVEGGEEIVEVIADGEFEYSYSEQWVLVRQQGTKLRIIVESNPTAETREGFITVSCPGEENQVIRIIQDGIRIEFESSEYEVEYMASTLNITIKANSEIETDKDFDWVDIQCQENNIVLNVARNYSMASRSGNIYIKAGDIVKQIAIRQKACTWYDSFEMVFVEGGTFTMGAQRKDNGIENYDESAYEVESPVHSVTVDGFYIGKFEVTQVQWENAMGNNPSTNKGDNFPVETVTWDEVQEFISLLNAETGLEYRLPTEAEWEYAARGGKLSGNYKYSGTPIVGACAWYYSNSQGTPHEVGLKEPNELGLFDMSGNVREWCEDWFDYYPSDDVSNPHGPVAGSGKVNRGGSWTTPAVNCRNTYRQTNYKYESAQDLGFRLVLIKE